jgi:hypothetical protein
MYSTPVNHNLHKSGIYQLKCSNCPLKYIGQSSRNFWRKEHISAIKVSKRNSTYAQHILDTQHTHDNKKQWIYFTSKKGHTLEQFHINSLNTKNYKWMTHHLHNPIFDLIVKYHTHNNKPLTNPPSPTSEENFSSLSTTQPGNTSL